MPSLQEALESAFEEHEAEEIVENPAAVVKESAESSTGTETPAKESSTEEGAQEPVSEDRKPKSEAKKAVADGQQTAQAQAAAQQAAATAVKAPVSWRPEVRGKFGSLPPDVQQEVIRREREVEQGLRAASNARQFVDTFSQVVTPYAAMLQSEGASPIQAVQALFNTAYQLRTAHPQQKAQLVAQMIQQFGVDVDMLDKALVSAIGGNQQQQQQRNDPTLTYIQRELAPVKQFMERIGGAYAQSQQRTVQEVATTMDAFANDPKNEFFEDVRNDMADLLELAARRGVKMTLQDAYQRATMAHPTISGILAERAVGAQAQRRNSAARRSRDASASLPSQGAPSDAKGSSKPSDLHSAVEAAWDSVENSSDS